MNNVLYFVACDLIVDVVVLLGVVVFFRKRIMDALAMYVSCACYNAIAYWDEEHNGDCDCESCGGCDSNKFN